MQFLKWCFLLTAMPALAFASSLVIHGDPLAFVLLAVTGIFFFALIGRYTAKLLNQPTVLGELVIGILVGNLFYYYGFQLMVLIREGSLTFDVLQAMLEGASLSQAAASLVPDPEQAQRFIKALSGPYANEFIRVAYTVDIFSRYGVIFLLFMVGLESSLEELTHTGRDSFFVALLGVAAPMLLGLVVVYWLMPNAPYQSGLFIAATLSATSIGISARVLSEMKKLATKEAKTILGAAILDDVLGLILLAIVSSIVVKGTVDGMMLLGIISSSVLFFAGALFLGPPVLHQAVYFFRFFEPREAKLFISILFIMLLSWLAALIHLASIIGAFIAGLILHDEYFRAAEAKQKGTPSIYHLLSPLESILSPIFFILIGMQVKLESFYNSRVMVLASALVIAAVLGKLLSGFGAHAKNDRLIIGIGMLPRGEVGLVFASIGRTLGVISDDLFSAVVLMVMVTTLITPPLLKARYVAKEKGSSK